MSFLVKSKAAIITPDQIGALATFLCSEAAAQIRGHSPSTEGGQPNNRLAESF
jgi:hypothetical protein